MSNAHALSLPTIEGAVARIWRAVLPVPRGRDDLTFFELSGESIAAVRLVSMVEEELGISIDVGDIFEEDPAMADFIRIVSGRLVN
jgi:peptidyl carrier protein